MKKEKKRSSGSSSSSQRKDGGSGSGISSVFHAVERLQSQDDSVSRRKRSTATVQQQRASSLAAISQQKVYTKLLETRILLQRSLQEQQQEQLQQEQLSKQLENKDDEETRKNSSSNSRGAIDQCNDLLIKLLTARRQLQNGRDSAKRGRSKNDDDDVVDYNSLVLNQHNDGDSRPHKKAKSQNNNNTLEEQLQKEYTTCQEEWQSVLNRCHYDVRLHTGAITAAQSQFRVVNSNFWQQVEATVVHQKQQKQQQQQQQHAQQRQRAAGAADADSDDSEHDDNDNAGNDCGSMNSDEDGKGNGKKKQKSYYQYPAFDDAKVYQQLLKDFVAVSSADHASQAGAASEAAQARLDKIARKKSKQLSSTSGSGSSKPVDRRASKGHKIRYTTMAKLVNFTFPLSRAASTSTSTGGSSMSNTLDEDAWFKSLFGGGGARMSTSSK